MINIYLTKGAPSSGKSTWALTKVAKDPNNYVRINNDQIREMCNGSVFSSDYEKIIAATRNFLIREALKRDKHIIVDNVNAKSYHFKEVAKIAEAVGKDIQVCERPFYLPLPELLERNSKRTGTARVDDAVVIKFFKDLGGDQFQYYSPKVEIFTKRITMHNGDVTPMVQDPSLPRAVIFDNDGTISLLNGRNPYDATNCDEDFPQAHVIECMKLYFNAGYQILFVSGREEKDRAPTERFYKKHFPEVTYELYMRPTGNTEKDVVIKERIFNENIKKRFFISGWFDDRLQVSKWVYESGLPLFRVNNPEAIF